MIGLAVAGAAAFGAADYLGGAATARAGTVRRVLLISEPVAVLALLAALPLSSGSVTAAAAGWGAAAGVAAGAGQALLYTALARDPAGVGAPLCGVASVAVPVLWAIGFGRATGARDWAGFALLSIAVVALCGPTGRKAPSGVILAAVGAGAAFGIYSVLLARSPSDSSMWPVLFAHAAVAAVVIVTWPAIGHPLTRKRPVRRRPMPGRAVALAALVGLFEAIAAAAVLAAARNDLAVAGAVAAIHPAVTVLLARLTNHEALGRQRAAGLVIYSKGVVLLAGH